MAYQCGGMNPSEQITEDMDMDSAENGYVHVFVKPLEHQQYSMLSWFSSMDGSGKIDRWILYIQAAVLAMFVIIFLTCDLTHLFDKLCLIAMPMCCIVFAHCAFALYLRRVWTSTSMYCFFCACFVGELIGQFIFGRWGATHPLIYSTLIAAVSIAALFSQLQISHQFLLISLVVFVRYLACVTLRDLPSSLRPMTAYICGICGLFVAKYIETVFKPPVNNCMTNEGKIPVIKRRRSSSSSAHGFTSHRAGRRTSLPALIQKSQSPSGYEMAVIGEVHGLISDMLADSSLPPHIISGLRAIGSLLKPPCENHVSMHRAKMNPLVSLNETNYGSDNEDLPYTGERPSSLPKRLRRSLPPFLLRRMSTSTWTTTTSATGMPTLEPEPCRQRSASVRLAKDTSPGASPGNSPSPSSPTRVMLTIPKSRSFSVQSSSTTTLAPPQPSRKTSPLVSSPEIADAGFRDNEIDDVKKDCSDDVIRAMKDTHLKRLTVTSDYESSDSPSDHSDNVAGTDDLSTTAASVAPKIGAKKCSALTTSVPAPASFRDTTNYDQMDCKHDDDGSKSRLCSNCQTILPVQSPEQTELFDLERLEKNALLSISRLNEWDYPIFELAETTEKYILSSVAYRLFQEVGLMTTFRIPIQEFFNYFHALELGYRDKPYHNREHATDVLHGVYYITTQPIPGFQHVKPEADFSTTIAGIHKRAPGTTSDTGDTELGTVNHQRALATNEAEYGVMGGNLPALELMALYTAAAMHDYDHPGRTNAFLVATHAPQAVLYNDRSVLENHHAAAAWGLFLSNPRYNFLKHLDNAEFKRFRYLVIESILATDLKRHFEIVAEFNAKVNDDDAPGIDWTSEADRILVSQIVIKLADINGPAKKRQLHLAWTDRITEEFYEQGDEEVSLGMPISPYMDRNNPQLVKLQQSFIHHLVALLVNACSAAGLLPGQWLDADDEDNSGSSDIDRSGTERDDDDDGSGSEPLMPTTKPKQRRICCQLTENLKDNMDMWNARLKDEEAGKEESGSRKGSITMEPIVEDAKAEMNEAENLKLVEEASDASGQCEMRTPCAES